MAMYCQTKKKIEEEEEEEKKTELLSTKQCAA
jgi:hypothetical protein